MNIEVYTPLSDSHRIITNRENKADNILLINDRESPMSVIRIHISNHDLMELSQDIQTHLREKTKT